MPGISDPNARLRGWLDKIDTIDRKLGMVPAGRQRSIRNAAIEPDFELTDRERRAIGALRRLAKVWPETLWLYSAGGTLNVMRLPGGGEPMRDGEDGPEVDPRYSITTIDIPNDGGDW